MKLLVQPHAGVAPLLSAIKSAKKNIDILIFRMDWKELETALKVASSQGVAVRALIAHTNRGGESKLRSLPVIDGECHVLGMVSRNDLMAAIAPEAV